MAEEGQPQDRGHDSMIASRMGEVAEADDWIHEEHWKTRLNEAISRIDVRVPRRRTEIAWRIALFAKHKTNIITVDK